MARVKKGERLIVTEHGVPVARISPYLGQRTLEEMVADGDAHAPTGSLLELLASPPLTIADAPSSQEILDELREDRV